MEIPTSHSSHFEHSTFVWDSVFSERRENFYVKEDLVAIEKGLNASRPQTSQEAITSFVDYKCGKDSSRYLYRSQPIRDYLRGLDLDCLRRGSIPDKFTPAVLIDDRNHSELPYPNPSRGIGAFRSSLNAHQFYVKLCQSVRLTYFPNSRLPPQSNLSSLAISRSSHWRSKCRKTLNASINSLKCLDHLLKNISYIPNGDPYCILALFATASSLQAVLLRDFVYRYLAFRAYLGMKIPVSLAILYYL